MSQVQFLSPRPLLTHHRHLTCGGGGFFLFLFKIVHVKAMWNFPGSIGRGLSREAVHSDPEGLGVGRISFSPRFFQRRSLTAIL